MTSSDEIPSPVAAPPAVNSSEVASASVDMDKPPFSPPEEGKGLGIENNGDSANGVDACSSDHEDGDGKDGLEHAVELFEKGAKAIEVGDFAEAVDCLSRALEIRAANYGELSPECASSYYKYGCALLYKAQEETDPLSDVPKNAQKCSAKAESGADMEGESSMPSVESKTQYSSSDKPEVEGSDFKNMENESESSEGDEEELGEGDEDDSDLDLAWKMLDIARAILEKDPKDSIEKANVLSALGEVSMEREDVETSLNDYIKALAIMENVVEPDNRRVVELTFRICLVLELGSKVHEAITYCEKAISLCKSRLERLREGSDKPASEPGNIGQEIPSEDTEINQLSSIATELEKKLEDLQHQLSNPKSVLAELLKGTTSSDSSRIAALESGEFDSPAVSTAANGGDIMHLGVVGRGIKRASITPIGGEPSPKKSPSDACVSEGISNPQSSEASTK